MLLLLIVISLGCIGQNTASNDALAKCLTSKGAKMYGAYTCPHCQNQKNEFGSSFQYIDYTECAADGPNANPKACTDAEIQGYPTWIIDSIKYEGEQDLGTLAKIAGCA